MTQVRSPHYVLTFDGGSRGNPGIGYGSYELRTCDNRARVERREYGERVTNNEAEYRTLIDGLTDTLATLRRAGKDPASYRVRVQGDSQLVIRQLRGEYAVKHPAMRALHEQAAALAAQFAAVDYVWHPRARSVETLGH
jgi:ribonuclease HI